MEPAPGLCRGGVYMPSLIRPLLKWSLIGVAAGWAFAGLLLSAGNGRLGGLWSGWTG
jgi:hypothetical protein